MVMLTADMVIARTKQSNLSLISKLNCWGSQLTDVSLIRAMPSLTVLSFSVNEISSLVDFQYCPKLQDLYLRKNNVKDLNEVCYLQGLSELKHLWLDGNPCSTSDEKYRLAVLRALPKLKKLDDTLVEPSEVEKALRFGRVLVHPDQQQEYYSDPDDDVYSSSYPRERTEQMQDEVIRQPSPEHVQYVEQRERINYSPEPAPPPVQQYVRQTVREYPQNNLVEPEIKSEETFMNEPPLEESPEPQIKYEEWNEGQVSPPPIPQRYASLPRSRTMDGELGCGEWKRNDRVNTGVCQGLCGGVRRPERRTNVLNAVLCLIKELDYPNLEVVAMAIKCRMEEMCDNM